MARRVRTTSIALLITSLCLPGSFLFRRRKDPSDERRQEAQGQIFQTAREAFAAVAAMKPRWQDAWEAHDTMELPPKFEPSELIPNQVLRAARDARFARRTLQHNRWNSRVEPLFDVVDEQAWNNLRGTLLTVSPKLVAIQDEYRDVLYSDERNWIDRALEQLGGSLRKARREHDPQTDIRLVTDTTFMALYSMEQLTSNIIDRSLQELKDEG